MLWLLLANAALTALAAASHCGQLAIQYSSDATHDQCTAGSAGEVLLTWDSEAARAAAALAAAPRQRARLQRAAFTPRAAPPPGTVAVLTTPSEELRAACAGAGPPCRSALSRALRVPRSLLHGAGALRVPPALLHARLSRRAAARPACAARALATRAFYRDAATLRNCDFAVAADPRDWPPAIARTVRELRDSRAHDCLGVKSRAVSRAELARELRDSGGSFLFVDYDAWAGASDVVPLPDLCPREEDSSRLVLLGDLTSVAPLTRAAIETFAPTAESLRRVLEYEVEEDDVEEAACRWASAERGAFDSPAPETIRPVVAVVLCEDDADFEEYERLPKVVLNSALGESGNIIFKSYSIECSAGGAFDDLISKSFDAKSLHTTVNGRHGAVIGAVAPAGAEGAGGGRRAERLRLPLLQYTPAAPRAPHWTSAGDARSLARALRRFAAAHCWTRLAVISDATGFAGRLLDALGDGELELDEMDAGRGVGDALEKIRAAGHRAVFVNAEADVAAETLAGATERDMTRDDRYAWIVREWNPTNATSGVDVAQITHWCAGDENATASEGSPELRAAMNRLWRGRDWPRHAVPLVDAILTLGYGFRRVVERAPEVLYDVHSVTTIRSLERQLTAGAGPGLLRPLRYSAATRAPRDPPVFAWRWRGTRRLALPPPRCASAAEAPAPRLAAALALSLLARALRERRAT